EWTPQPRVALTAGIRLNVTFEEREGEEEAGPKSAAEEAGHQQTNVRPSASVGALFKLWERGTDHVRAYANYRDTFKPAAIDFGIGESGGGEGEEERLLEPETSRSIDGGVKTRMANGKVDWEADVFLMDFENLVTAATVNGVPALI